MHPGNLWVLEGAMTLLPDKWFWRFSKTLFRGSALQRRLAVRALHQGYRPLAWPVLAVRWWMDKRGWGKAAS